MTVVFDIRYPVFKGAIIPKTVYHEPLDPKIGQYTLLDVMKNAEPQRYRLIDCSQLTQHQTLSICEFGPFPHVRYAAVSYVWRGNAVPEGYEGIEFSIVGAEAADPIGVEVLHDTCMTALAKGATHIWILLLNVVNKGLQSIRPSIDVDLYGVETVFSLAVSLSSDLIESLLPSSGHYDFWLAWEVVDL